MEPKGTRQSNTMRQRVDPRLLAILVCPRCHSEMVLITGELSCCSGHHYPIVDGIPVFVLPEKDQTIDVALASYTAAVNATGGPLYLETIGLTASERAGIQASWEQNKRAYDIDPAISYLIGATSGRGYVDLIGQLYCYPIPEIPIERGRGKLLLDIGCNWGRWSISAARKGWRVVGIDPSLGAVMAACRAFNDEHNVTFVCADARFLPFKNGAFDVVFSYSVLQHFSEADANMTLREIGRVMARHGFSKIQMAHRGGLRSRYIRSQSKYLEGEIFQVRYWSLTQLKNAFNKHIGRSVFVAEAFGGLGLLPEDWRVVSPKAKVLILISAILRKIAWFIRPLTYFADSVYIVSRKS
jgi:SAM-dependent methyltransferase/uncharacterized protein YbaR (Trm112 family)